MDSNKTIDRRSVPHPPEDEAVDPEEQETVLFGQRHLFQDVDLKAAKRQAEARSGRQRRYPREEGSAADVADTVVTSSTADAGTDPILRPTDGQTPAGQQADGGSWQKASDALSTVEVSAGADTVVDQDSVVEREQPSKRDHEPQQDAKVPGDVAERQVAERRPEAGRGAKDGQRRTADLSSSCRMCGKAVHWPKARRFRGSKKSAHGFRCDTCGNVFCSEHVQRISGFWESLFHHGRFRCLLCALGQMARQAEQARARATRSD